jgi:GNAT superfamily N-acetyltransferase
VHRILTLIRYVRLLLANGLIVPLVKSTWDKLFGSVVYADVSLDPREFRRMGPARADLVVRPAGDADIGLLRRIMTDGSLPASERFEAVRRLAMLSAGIQTCYVVRDGDGNVCFLQWLVDASQNEALRAHYGDWYPVLSPGEALMESAYVFPAYRRTGILPAAVGAIIDRARESGVERVLGMISVSNKNSWASFMRLGFVPERIRLERTIFGHRRRTSSPFSVAEDEQALRAILPATAVPLVLGMRALAAMVKMDTHG